MTQAIQNRPWSLAGSPASGAHDLPIPSLRALSDAANTLRACLEARGLSARIVPASRAMAVIAEAVPDIPVWCWSDPWSTTGLVYEWHDDKARKWDTSAPDYIADVIASHAPNTTP